MLLTQKESLLNQQIAAKSEVMRPQKLRGRRWKVLIGLKEALPHAVFSTAQ